MTRKVRANFLDQDMEEQGQEVVLNPAARDPDS